MTAGKAASIIKKAGGFAAVRSDANLLIEYGDAERPTSSYRVRGVDVTDGALRVELYVEAVACKPALAAAGGVAELACC